MRRKMVIFVVEDDPAFNKLMSSFLTAGKLGIVKSFLSGEECIAGLDVQPDIVLQDYDMTGINGIETMKQVKAKYPLAEYIFLSGQSSIQVAVEALKLGAYDYIIKDAYAKDNALNKVKRLVAFNKMKDEKKAYKFYFIVGGIIVLISWTLSVLNFIGII